MSERPRRRDVPWERRRLAGIFSAFQVLFFFAAIVLDSSRRTQKALTGSFDRPEVQSNGASVMQGGEDTFRLRKGKYGF